MTVSENIGEYYTYSTSSPFLGNITISTKLVDNSITSIKPRYGCRAYSTQKIMNNLPAWMEMRKNHESIAQQLTHAWGKELDDTISLYNEYRANQFIGTSDTFCDISTGISDLSFSEYKVYEPRLVNLLFNSSFSIKGAARLQKPEGWHVERDELNALSFYTEDTLFGENSLLLDGSIGEVVLKQSREYTQSGGSLNLSIFVKTIGSTGSTTSKVQEHKGGIILVLQYADGETRSYGIGFPNNTQDKWARATFSVEVTKKIFKYEVLIINRTAYIYAVDLPQLEVGKSATNWTPSLYDTPIFLNSNVRHMAAVQVLLGKSDGAINKLELLAINSSDEFKDTIIPTRIEAATIVDNPRHSFNLEYLQEVTYGKEELPTKWVVYNNKIRQQSITTPDVYGEEMLPVDLYMNEDGVLLLNTYDADNGNISVCALTIYNNWMFVVTKESYMGSTKYVLKFVRPGKLTYDDVYLQSFGDIELPLDLAGNPQLDEPEDTITRIGICKNIPFTIFIDTDLRKRFYFSMKYDYTYADFRQRKLYCRENYVANGSRLQVV